MFLIELPPRNNSRRFARLLAGDQKGLISGSLLHVKSIDYKFGKLTKWSIFLIELLDNTKNFNCSSPSNKGTY